MNIGFRVDGSTVIGTGHVMRCLTLAATLRDAGAACVFVCRDHPGNLAGRIRAEGHEAVLLAVGPGDVGETPARPGDHASWVGASWERDAAQTVAALGAHRPSWIVVDHYGLDARWEALVAAGLGARILAIDGQADRPHDCDALLDQTYSPRGAARWDGLVPARCRVFAGPGYSLLRPEFEAARATLRERDGVVRRLLVAFGGVDVPGATGIALEAVARGRTPDLCVDVVAGAGNPHLEDLRRRCRELGYATLHVEPRGMAALMAAADLAVGGGGTMMWERCAMGLPTVVVAIAGNQVEGGRLLAAAGGCLYAGDLDEARAGGLEVALRDVLSRPDTLRAMSVAASNLMRRPAGETPAGLLLAAAS